MTNDETQMEWSKTQQRLYGVFIVAHYYRNVPQSTRRQASWQQSDPWRLFFFFQFFLSVLVVLSYSLLMDSN